MENEDSFLNLGAVDKKLEESKLAQDIANRYGGRLPNLFKVEGIVSDRIIDAHNYLYSELVVSEDGGPLSRRLREMIAYEVSKNNQCPYCSYHHGNSLDEQSTQEQLPSEPENEKESALLDFAVKITTKSYTITQKDHAQLEAMGWSEKERVHCLLIASYFNFANRIANASGIPIENT